MGVLGRLRVCTTPTTCFAEGSANAIALGQSPEEGVHGQQRAAGQQRDLRYKDARAANVPPVEAQSVNAARVQVAREQAELAAAQRPEPHDPIVGSPAIEDQVPQG